MKTGVIEADSAAGDFIKAAARHRGRPSALLPLRRKLSEEMDDVLMEAGNSDHGHIYRPGVQGPINVETMGEPQ